MAVSNKRNVRGKTRGINLDRLIEADGGNPLPITLNLSDGKQTGKYCENLSNEIGLIVRQHAPVIMETWNPPLDTWLNVSHSHKCTRWLSCHVSLP